MNDERQDLQEVQNEENPELVVDQRRVDKLSQAERERDKERDTQLSVEEQSEQSFPASDPPSF
jgi:hypothetical protein